MLLGIFFGLIALFAYAIGDIFVTQASKKVGNVKTLFWQLVLAFTLSSLYLPFALPIENYGAFFLSALLGLILFAGTLIFFKALEIGNAALVGPIGGSYSALVVLLSLIIYHEKLNLLQSLGVSLTILGVAIASFKWNELKQLETKNLFSDKGLAYSFIGMILFAIYLTLVKIPASKIGWFWQPYTYNLTFLLLLGYTLFKKKSLSLKKNQTSLIPILISAVLLTTAHFAYNLGILNGYVSIVGPITGCQAVVYFILARIFFKEKMSRQQITGIITALLGILFLSIA